MLTGAAADQRIHAIGQLRQVKFDFSPLVDLVVSMATSFAKTVREPALSILETRRVVARPLLEQSLTDKESGVRHEAVGALWRLFGADCSDTLRAHRKQKRRRA